MLRLSTVLGCSIEDLLLDDLNGAPLLKANCLDIGVILGQHFYSEKYQTAGRWVCSNNRVATLFYYNGEQYMMPFKAVFTLAMLPCLKEAAVLQIEAKIEDRIFHANGFESWWGEWKKHCMDAPVSYIGLILPGYWRRLRR